jgi:hypothetical protein
MLPNEIAFALSIDPGQMDRALALDVADDLLAFRPFPARAHDHMHHDIQMEAPQPLPGRSIYNLDSKWTTQDGTSVALGALAGGPIVTAMGYTTYKDICPAIVADMMWVEKHLPRTRWRVCTSPSSPSTQPSTPRRG